MCVTKRAKKSGTEKISIRFVIIEVVDVTKVDCMKSFDLPMNDFEDAILAHCAKRIKADYIITRNVKDFINSPVNSITPKDFLSKFFPDG